MRLTSALGLGARCGRGRAFHVRALAGAALGFQSLKRGKRQLEKWLRTDPPAERNRLLEVTARFVASAENPGEVAERPGRRSEGVGAGAPPEEGQAVAALLELLVDWRRGFGVLEQGTGLRRDDERGEALLRCHHFMKLT